MSLFEIDAGKEWRGGQRQSLLLSKILLKKGYRPFLVVQPKSPLYHRAKEAATPLLPVKMRTEFDPLAIIRLALSMKLRKCVLAHFHDAHAVAIGASAASLAKVPLRLISRRVDFPLKKNFFSRRKYTKNINAIIAISEAVKRVLLNARIPPSLIEVIPSGIDFSPFEEVSSRDFLRREFSFDADDYLVGIVAQLEDHKGHKYLIQATRILKERTRKIKIIVVGEGSLRMELDEQVRSLRVGDIVYFLGFREDIPRILASLDLFVLSSHLEGLGSSILDAMASRLAVVATQTGGIPEVVIPGETGLLVPPRDPQALAEAIYALYQNRDLAARFGQRGYEVVRQKFSAEAMAEKVISLYERLASQKNINLSSRQPD